MWEYRPLVINGREFNKPSMCPTCTEEWEREQEEQARRIEKQRREQQREWRVENIHKLLHDTGVNPWAHGDSTFDSWDAGEAGEEARRQVREFLTDIRDADPYEPVQGVYLYGPTGTGKTHLAAALVRELLVEDQWKPGHIRVDHAATLITEVQDCYGSDRSVLEVKEKRETARLWVLDDLGTERPSDDVVRILTEILNHREGRPTMVTSNLRPDKLEGRHPELGRVVSRLGPRYYRYVEVDGRDRRFDAA